MKIQTTNAYVFKNTRSPLQTNAGKRAGVPSSLKLALVTVLSATVLSGCLMEGDVSGSKSRSKLMQELHTTYLAENAAQLEQNGGREVGATGGTGTAIESANLEASTANTGSSVSNNSTETSVPSTGALTTAPETTPETGALISATPLSDHYPGTNNYSKPVELPSCDAADAVRISTAAGLSQITHSNKRVFCIAPGDYRSYGLLSLTKSGTADKPKVILFESSNFSADDEIFTAPEWQLARMPALDIRNTSNWVVHKMAFMNLANGYYPIRMSGATNIVIDRIRVENNRSGIEFRHGTHDSYLQNSFIGNQRIPQGSGNDGVCVAFMGHFRQVELGGHIDYDYHVSTTNNHIVNNEIVNCNDGIQIVWMPQYKKFPDFSGTVMAGNDIYLTDAVRTNCYGSLNPNGNCTHMENPIDLKGGALDASNPVRIYDNRMWGYRKTDSNYNRPANSWGSAISGHYRSVKNVHMYENVIWDVPSAISFSRGTSSSVIRDNIFTQIRGEGINNGIALVTATDSYDLDTYINVDKMTVERNHIIVSNDGSTTGAAWLSSTATNSSFNCNVVANGSWGSGNMSGGNTGRNTWYNTNSGQLSRSSDSVFSSFNSANMGRLCFDTKRASVPGGERVCLDDVLDTPNSSNACASEYWTSANWPSN